MKNRPFTMIAVCFVLCAATLSIHVWLIARHDPHRAEAESAPAAPAPDDPLPGKVVTHPPQPPKPFLTLRPTWGPTPTTIRPDPEGPERRLPVGESAWSYEAQGMVQFRLIYGYTPEGRKTERHVMAEFPRVGPEREAAWRDRRLPRNLDHVRGDVVLRYPTPLVPGRFTVSQAYSAASVPVGVLYTDEEFLRAPNEPRVLDDWARWAQWDGWPRTSTMWSRAGHHEKEFGDGQRTVAEGAEVILHEWAEGSSVIEGEKPGAFVQLVVRRIPAERVRALTVVPDGKP